MIGSGKKTAPSVAPQTQTPARAVRWSSGMRPPRIALPMGAVDCHHHIYDTRFPADERATLVPPEALVEDYEQLKLRLGFTRHVIVQPSTYGTDNRCLLDALARFGASARGVVVVDEQIDKDSLLAMHEGGVRGVRFNLSLPGGLPIEAMPAMAKRIAPYGWHIQVVAKPDKIMAYADLLANLPVPLVFDHLGQIPAPAFEHPAYEIICALLERRRAWLKISGLYTFGTDGAPRYGEAEALALGYLGRCPERLVWGTDWPHPTMPEDAKPDDAMMVDLISDWIGSPNVSRRIFASNPAELYGFDEMCGLDD